jgi:uncharacterized protein (TIGR02145 family)
LTDERDNKVYPVVKIGGRWIMARNLNYQVGLTHNTESVEASGNTFNTVGAGTYAIGSFWCPGGNGTTSSNQSNCNVWGALYTWETAMMVDGKWTSSAHTSSTWSEPSYGTATTSGNTQNHARSDAGAVIGGRGICPPNWHVPTDGEWGDLLNAIDDNTKNHNSTYNTWLGGNAGTKAKSACVCSSDTNCDTNNGEDAVTSWHGGPNNIKGTDVYGFRVLPSGSRVADGSNFSSRGSATNFWSSSAFSASNAWCRVYNFSMATVNRYSAHTRSNGFPVRCIRDEGPTPPGAASTLTWTFGEQTWSDRIVAAPTNCASTSTFPTAGPPPAQYKVSDGRYYYNWVCMNAAYATLCPSPWHVPSSTEFRTLISNLGGGTQSARDQLLGAWGAGGYADGSALQFASVRAYYWSVNPRDAGGAQALYYGSSALTVGWLETYQGAQIRCVK